MSLHRSNKLSSSVLFLLCYLPDYLDSFTNAVGGDSHLQEIANEIQWPPPWTESPFYARKRCRNNLPHPQVGASDAALLVPRTLCLDPQIQHTGKGWDGELQFRLVYKDLPVWKKKTFLRVSGFPETLSIPYMMEGSWDNEALHASVMCEPCYKL